MNIHSASWLLLGVRGCVTEQGPRASWDCFSTGWKDVGVGLGLYVLHVLYGDSVHVKFKMCNRVLGSCNRMKRNTVSQESPSHERLCLPPQKQLLLVHPPPPPAVLFAVHSTAGGTFFPPRARRWWLCHRPLWMDFHEFLSSAVTGDCSNRPCTHSAPVSRDYSPTVLFAGPKAVLLYFSPCC